MSSAAAHRPARTLTTSAPLSRLSAVILLSGAVRSSDLARSIGRSILDLPIDANTSILQQWRDQAEKLTTSLGGRSIDLRVTVDQNAILPHAPAESEHVRVSVGHDPNDYRGTAGLIRDLSLKDPEDSYLLVANGNQILLEPLDELAHELSDRGGDIILTAHDDGAPAGVMLIRVGAIRGVRELGFMDFKEQVLPKLAQDFDVRVVHKPHATGLPVRNLDGYITALTAHHKRLAGKPIFDDEAGSEQWFSTFSIIEPGANVAASARVHDAVILDGAQVGADAVIVRSVVAGSASVRPGQLAADRVVDRSTNLSGKGFE